MHIDHVQPADIEKTSLSIIRQELAQMGKVLPEEESPVILRAIHTTADFDYAESLYFSKDAVKIAKEALKNGAHIVTDTNMAASGISKRTLARFGGHLHCFMAEEEVAAEAKQRGVTRATVSMEYASKLGIPIIYAIGNAPTALIKLRELIDAGYRPELIIGVPVGFVNVVASKELIMETDIPCIINKGRKGGSTVAAAICNALLYELDETRGNG